ncbi:MAG TPA: Fur family transcriptional regulator [Holophaga sp.]|nr:Fur family transcriptional regulator [Holophaga sp.]
MILEYFLREPGHVTAEDLYGKIRGAGEFASQSTVYRAMKLLSASGLAKEVDFGDGVVRYEQAYGHIRHDHLICKRCGKNVEITDQSIQAQQERIAREHGFSLAEQGICLYGICADCAKEMIS